MKRGYKVILLLLAGLLAPSAGIFLLPGNSLVWAQEGSVAILEYADDLHELEVIDSDGFTVDLFLGIALSPGDRMTTGYSGAELRLDPAGSLLRIAPHTSFEINTFQGHQGASTTRSTLRRGAARLVVAPTRDRSARYTMDIPGAVLGVRGTDFGVSLRPRTAGDLDDAEPEDPEPGDLEQEPPGPEPPGQEPPGQEPPGQEKDVAREEFSPAPPPTEEDLILEEIFVFSGQIIVTERDQEREIYLAARQGITLGEEPFLPQAWSDERIGDFQEGLRFEFLDPSSLLSRRVEEEAADQEEPRDRDPDLTATVAVPLERPRETAPDPEDPAPPGTLERGLGRLVQATGMQMGAVTINRETYGQVVFQPRITTNRLDAAFYLPVTYRENIFDPDDWYQPEGNNEWSFGTDQDWSDDPAGALHDLVTDLALKVQYFRYGREGDPFQLHLGNLNSFTIGQGLLMRDYANDLEFPATRRLGVFLAIDRPEWGFQAMVNDAADPGIYGGRLFARPAAPVNPAEVGFSVVTDRRPATALPQEPSGAQEAADQGDPLFTALAMDVAIPFIRRETSSLIGYTEAGFLVPFVRNSTDLEGQSISSGVKTNALVDFDSGRPRNFGWTTGIRGWTSSLRYRLEYQYYNGAFRPGFYGPTYDRLRGSYAAETLAYLADPDAKEYRDQSMAVAGEAEITFFEILHLGAGYRWPWEISSSGHWEALSEDEFLLRLTLTEGVLPLGIGMGAEYRRRYFAAALGEWGGYDQSDLLDEHTTLAGHITYPVSDLVKITARVSTTLERDKDGEIIYDSDGRPKMTPMVVIQTEIGF
ncbi:FecR family protein [Alkalispirochaeta americana]|uniref:FecR family protein n=1 Tax=Alkalispirochaeta americana TaxID=159291 RepID=A0A1N6ND40_9SPIO|nr:FecR domain-containing protein [Alkalispirochaeta americana]SIP89985.1 FecR family protein [Alkalispirochaeta americana]